MPSTPESSERRAGDHPSAAPRGSVLPPGAGRRIRTSSDLTIKASGARDVADFAFVENVVPGHWSGRGPHFHRRHEELFYVVEGELQFLLDGDPVPAQAGTFVGVPPGVVHAYRNLTGVPARWVGTIAPHDLEEYFVRLSEILARPRGARPWVVAAALGEPEHEAIARLREDFDTEEVDVPQWREGEGSR
jgi:uncharacterized cupin superfamily protein